VASKPGVKAVVTVSGDWPVPVDLVLPQKFGYFRFINRVVQAASGCRVVILRGTSGFDERYRELVAALVIKLRFRRRPVVVIGDATWTTSSESLARRAPPALRPLLPWLSKWVARLPDGPHVTYCVLSTDEQASFGPQWGVDSARVRFTPFFATVADSWLAKTSDDGYIFAGGNSQRDYGLLVEAVEGLGYPVKIASAWQPDRPLPPNVTVEQLGAEQYDSAMAGATMVVVPLARSPRSAGQQTYLNAMRLAKPVVVTNAAGVCDYVRPGQTGQVVEHDPASLRAAIDFVLDPANEDRVGAMVAAARLAVEQHYLRAHYLGRLWEVAAEAVASGGRTA